jgi:hypothetical protein
LLLVRVVALLLGVHLSRRQIENIAPAARGALAQETANQTTSLSSLHQQKNLAHLHFDLIDLDITIWLLRSSPSKLILMIKIPSKTELFSLQTVEIIF